MAERIVGAKRPGQYRRSSANFPNPEGAAFFFTPPFSAVTSP